MNRIFNGYGEMDETTCTMNGTTLYNWTLTRDNAGRIAQKSEYMGGSAMIWDYAYDTLGRLTEVRQNNVVVESYTYDANGNRLTEMNDLRYIDNKIYTYSNEDHVITAGADTYQFNQDGFLTSKITSAGTSTYNYSSRGELLSATLPDGTAISYDNDPMGRRITKRVNGTITEKYLWQGMTRLLAVYDGSNNLIMRFTYADGRMPVSMTKGGVTYYLFYDEIGTLKLVVNSSGTVIKDVFYDTFGSIIDDSNPSFSMPLGFAGGLHDRDTELVRFGFRDYDPTIGKWAAKDPIDFKGGDVNLFGYVGNNPIKFIDPFGLEILICNRPTSWGIGNHAYAWDTRGAGVGYGMQGSSTSWDGHANEEGPSQNPNSCNVVENSGDREDEIMDYLRENADNGLWFPFINDCHNAVEDAVSAAGLQYPGAPGGRFGDIP